MISAFGTLALLACFTVMVAVSIALWNASQSEDKAIARAAPSVARWILLSLSGALAWIVLIMLVFGLTRSFEGIQRVAVLIFQLLGPALYIRSGYQWLEKTKIAGHES